MCGVAGLLSFDGQRVTEKQLRSMGDAIEHRGRDAQGVFVRDGVGLVHQRLTLLDTSAAADQPMHDADGRFSLVFNGEITNYIELRKELEAVGCRFRTRSDTEVLLEAWRHWGRGALVRLHGFFAFALIDWKHRSCFLARDPIGIKPLYLQRCGGIAGFASEPKALFATDLFDVELDPYGLADYLAMQLYLPGRTLYKNVRSILPGTVVEIELDSGEEMLHRYWQLPEPEEAFDLSYDECIEDLAGSLADTVGKWIRSDFPIGAYVSGGLDSSLLAALAAAQPNAVRQGGALQTFSSVFQSDTFLDERAESDAVAAHIRSQHTAIELDLEEVVADHYGLMRGLDMPIAGYSAPYRTMARHVRKSVKGALCGHGGDEWFGGYPRYLAVSNAQELSGELQGNFNGAKASDAMSYLTGFEEQARTLIGVGANGTVAEMQMRSLDRGSFLIDRLSPDVRRELDGYNPLRQAIELNSGSRGSVFKQQMRLDQILLLPALLHVEDRTSMMENLETRPVLLDHGIMEKAAKIPTPYLLKNGLKSVLRDVGKKFLPDEVTSNKRKSGIMYPVMACLEDPRLVEMRENAFCDLDRSGLFEVGAKDMLSTEKELINKRVTWGLWSLGDCLSSFGLV